MKIYVPRVAEILEFFADEDGWRINVCLIFIPVVFIDANCK